MSPAGFLPIPLSILAPTNGLALPGVHRRGSRASRAQIGHLAAASAMSLWRRRSLLSPRQSPPSFRSAASCPEKGLLFLSNTRLSSPPGSQAHHAACSPGGAIGSDSAFFQIRSSSCYSRARNPVAPSSPVSGPLGSHLHLLSPPALSAFHLLGIRLAAAPRPPSPPPRPVPLWIYSVHVNMSFLFLKGFGVGTEKFTMEC
nr:uncharacterized protein LOC129024096 [Pongo pygmaeus]